MDPYQYLNSELRASLQHKQTSASSGGQPSFIGILNGAIVVPLIIVDLVNRLKVDRSSKVATEHLPSGKLT